jgi:hypothetical protein
MAEKIQFHFFNIQQIRKKCHFNGKFFTIYRGFGIQ